MQSQLDEFVKEVLCVSDCVLRMVTQRLTIGPHLWPREQPDYNSQPEHWDIQWRFKKKLITLVPSFEKVSSYIEQYPILRAAQSALHFTSLADLFNQTPSQLLSQPCCN